MKFYEKLALALLQFLARFGGVDQNPEDDGWDDDYWMY
jgi:hypothetical protein